MRIISKAVVAGSLTFYSLLGGKFCYQEWNLRKTLPKEEICIGEKDEKKAVVIGTYYDRSSSVQYIHNPPIYNRLNHFVSIMVFSIYRRGGSWH